MAGEYRQPSRKRARREGGTCSTAPLLLEAVWESHKLHGMVIVTGTIQARLDTLDELRRLSVEHVARSRAEPGCLEHGVAVDANDELRLVFFERWADRDALLAHFCVPASREFAAQVARLAAHPPDLHVYDAGVGEIALR